MRMSSLLGGNTRRRIGNGSCVSSKLGGRRCRRTADHNLYG
ncbi:MAG TPA: hypothetical protein VGM51_15635 [Armatimonadota bacterium]